MVKIEMQHPGSLGAPMKKDGKVAYVMKEFGRGELKSSSGNKVTNPKQALAIGYSEAQRARKNSDRYGISLY